MDSTDPRFQCMLSAPVLLSEASTRSDLLVCPITPVGFAQHILLCCDPALLPSTSAQNPVHAPLHLCCPLMQAQVQTCLSVKSHLWVLLSISCSVVTQHCCPAPLPRIQCMPLTPVLPSDASTSPDLLVCQITPMGFAQHILLCCGSAMLHNTDDQSPMHARLHLCCSLRQAQDQTCLSVQSNPWVLHSIYCSVVTQHCCPAPLPRIQCMPLCTCAAL